MCPTKQNDLCPKRQSRALAKKIKRVRKREQERRVAYSAKGLGVQFACSRSDAGRIEARQSRPIPEARRVASNPNEHTVRRRPTIQNEQLVPARWRYLRVRWRCDSTDIVSRTRERRENRAAAHGVAVGTRRRRNQ